MIRILFLFIILTLTGFITIWLKKDPGNIAIEWQGWILETSVPIIIALTLFLFFLVIVCYLFIKKIISIPQSVQSRYKKNKKSK